MLTRLQRLEKRTELDYLKCHLDALKNASVHFHPIDYNKQVREIEEKIYKLETELAIGMMLHYEPIVKDGYNNVSKKIRLAGLKLAILECEKAGIRSFASLIQWQEEVKILEMQLEEFKYCQDLLKEHAPQLGEHPHIKPLKIIDNPNADITITGPSNESVTMTMMLHAGETVIIKRNK